MDVNYNGNKFVPIVFYLGAIFWTLGYDTIYGFQDIEDDEIIGVKSTSIKFKKNPKFFIFLCYFLFFIFYIDRNNYEFFINIFYNFICYFTFIFLQIYKFNKKIK